MDLTEHFPYTEPAQKRSTTKGLFWGKCFACPYVSEPTGVTAAFDAAANHADQWNGNTHWADLAAANEAAQAIADEKLAE